MLDEAHLRSAIRRSRDKDDTAAMHRDRLAFTRKGIREQEAALDRATEQWSKAEDEDDRRSFEHTRERLKRELRSLRTDLTDLEAYVPSGFSEDEEAALLAFTAETRAGLENATADEKRALIGYLRLEGAVAADPDGPYHVGRHRYRIAWGGEFDLAKFLGSESPNIRKFGIAAERCNEAAVATGPFGLCGATLT